MCVYMWGGGGELCWRLGLGRITARILLLLLPSAVAEEEEEELTLYQHNTQYTLLKGGGRLGWENQGTLATGTEIGHL